MLSLTLPISPLSLAEDKKIEGGVEQNEAKVLQSGVSKEIYTGMDVQLLKTAFYYYPDADVYYQLLKEEGQKQYPHLLGYREIDGLYTKALSQSEFQEELTEWKYQGGPTPYYINAGVHVRNNGQAAITDVKITFNFEVKVATLKAKPKTLTTDYKDLSRNARWQKWMTQTVNVKIIPPGENTIIHTENISLAVLFEKLKNKWPETMRVKTYVYSPLDSRKDNNYSFKSINIIPDHFVMSTLH